jgi:hypothetical protein
MELSRSGVTRGTVIVQRRTENRQPTTETGKALKALYLFSASHQRWLSRSTSVLDAAGPQLPAM